MPRAAPAGCRVPRPVQCGGRAAVGERRWAIAERVMPASAESLLGTLRSRYSSRRPCMFRVPPVIWMATFSRSTAPTSSSFSPPSALRKVHSPCHRLCGKRERIVRDASCTFQEAHYMALCWSHANRRSVLVLRIALPYRWSLLRRQVSAIQLRMKYANRALVPRLSRRKTGAYDRIWSLTNLFKTATVSVVCLRRTNRLYRQTKHQFSCTTSARAYCGYPPAVHDPEAMYNVR